MKMVFHKFLVFLLLAFLTSCFSNRYNIEEGVLDMSKITTKEQESIELTGNWLFYWKQLPKIDSLGSYQFNPIDSKPMLSDINESWKSLGVDSKGYGSYHLKLINVDTTRAYTLRILRIRSAAEAWVNGKKLEGIGKISKDEDTSIAHGGLLYVNLPKTSTIDIVVAVSNYHHVIGGGASFGISIGDKEKITNIREKKILVETSSTILILIISLYSMFTQLLQKRRKPLLFYFGMFTASIAVRQFFVGEVIVYEFFPDISFHFVQKMRYIPVYFGLSFGVLYFKELLPKQSLNVFVKTTIGFSIIMFLFVSFSSTYISTHSPKAHIYYVWLFLLYITYLVIRSLKDNVSLSKFIFFSTLIAVITMSNDLLHSENQISSAFISNLGMVVFLFMQSMINHKHNKDILERAEKLSQQVSVLKEEVSLLLTESIQALRSKQELTSKLDQIQKDNSSNTLTGIIRELKSEKLKTERLLTLKENIKSFDSGFNIRLKEKHASLTNIDIEVCVFINIGLSTSDIATLRGVSLVSVKTTRYRVRKKIGLSQEESLSEYLATI